MELSEKLEILSSAAKYDVSCSSSGSKRATGSKGVGNTDISGICHSWSKDGRCISLLKILFSNECIYDCAYCINRRGNDIPRATFTPGEIADLTLNFYRRNYMDGLFLSSAVFHSPDHTMELLLETVSILRKVHEFDGYIHTKAIPGASVELILLTGLYSDRMSINVELPSEMSLRALAPQKNFISIFSPMNSLSTRIAETRAMVPQKGRPGIFLPGGQSTQLIVGLSPETDLDILDFSQSLYSKYDLKRVYYSAYVPVSSDPRLPAVSFPPLLREHRLYQADWLMRYYNFKAEELLDPSDQFLPTDLDPKSAWALRHPEFFPIEINTASYQELLRVPGIGVLSAKRIIRERHLRSLRTENLHKTGVVMKRARYFILCNGHRADGTPKDHDQLRNILATPRSMAGRYFQLELFPCDHELLPVTKR